MRIALITPGFSAHTTDWCIPVLLNHVKQLTQNHDVHVFPLRYPHQRAPYQVFGANVHPIGGATAKGLARGPLLVQALRRIQNEARIQPFDVYHGCWADEPGFLAALLGLVTHRPAVVSLMGGELAHFPELGYGGRLSRANRALQRLALRFATHVTAGSAYLQRLAQPYVNPVHMRIHSWGVDINLFNRHGVEDLGVFPLGSFNILQVASLIGIKDHHMSLQALQQSGDKTIRLHLIGTGPLQSTLKQTCRMLGVEDQVSFHEDVAHDTLPAYYRAADVCLLTSRHEAQAMVVLEAAACGRATIGTSVGLVPELVPMGLSVPPKDAESLARIMVALRDNQKGLDQLNHNVHRLTQTQYSLAKSAADLTHLYRIH